MGTLERAKFQPTVSRRHFLRSGGTAVMYAVAGSALLAACGEDDEGTAGGSEGSSSGDLGTLRVAITSPTVPVLITNTSGPLDYGPEFGLDIARDDVVNFSSHNTAVQAMLSGDSDIIGGSTGVPFSLIEQGEDFKLFAPYMQSNAILMVGRNGLSSIDDIVSQPDVRIASDGPGGGYYFVWNAFFVEEGLNVNLEEELNLVILEEPPQVNTAFVNGDVDAALLHFLDLKAVEEQLGDEMTVIGRLYEDVPPMAFEAWAAPTTWIDENMDKATAYAKSMITAARELCADFDAYKTAVNEYVEGGFPGPDEELQALWTVIRENEIWPYNEITQESVTRAAETAELSGSVEDASNMDGAVDTRPQEAALEELGRVTVEDIIG